MEIVAATEVAPRGVYTGAIGWAGPEGRARWNVAIRTVVADRDRGVARATAPAAASSPTRAPRASTRSACSRRASSTEPPFALFETFAHLPGRGLPPPRRPPRAARRLGAPLRLSARRCGASRRRCAKAAGSLVGAARVRLLARTATARVAVEATAAADAAPARTLQLRSRGASGRPREHLALPQDDAARGLRRGGGLAARLRRRAAVERPRRAHRVDDRERRGRDRRPAPHAARLLRPAARRRARGGARRGPRARGCRADRRRCSRASGCGCSRRCAARARRASSAEAARCAGRLYSRAGYLDA